MSQPPISLGLSWPQKHLGSGVAIAIYFFNTVKPLFQCHWPHGLLFDHSTTRLLLMVRPDFCSWTGLEASPRSMGYWGGWKIPWCRMKSPPWMSRGMWWFLGWENVRGFSQNHGTWLNNGFLKWKVPFVIFGFSLLIVGDFYILLVSNVDHNFSPPI